MEFQGFTAEDFDVFLIDGLNARMEAIKKNIRPKLESLGSRFSPDLSVITGDQMFVHVAKHARRTINPPKDTWVAFASNPRGYKMLPHFQIGLWHTHLFIWFALIYEAPNKGEIGTKLFKKASTIYKEIPDNFSWSTDHTKPDTIFHKQLTKSQFQDMFTRLTSVKKAELLCGYTIEREDAINMAPEKLLQQIEYVFKTVAPLYNIAVSKKNS